MRNVEMNVIFIYLYCFILHSSNFPVASFTILLDFSGATLSVLSRFSGWKIVTELTSNLSIIVLVNVINFKTISCTFPPLLSRSFPRIWIKTCPGWRTRTQEISVSIYSLFVIRPPDIPRKCLLFYVQYLVSRFCSTSRRLVPLFVRGRTHTEVSQEIK